MRALLVPHSGGWHSNVEYHKLVYYQGDGGRKISLSAIRHLRWFQQVTRPNQYVHFSLDVLSLSPVSSTLLTHATISSAAE